ncbi:unnamed protein product [Diatraea saccharalis]|uniref:LAIKA domain-containing protein n=1 Tax=Diatraea saccharalis TaxID=40085 RepID=A0A9N9REI4_9NEOP|nr:unnamed protein product [Diatraea saccharalis]
MLVSIICNCVLGLRGQLVSRLSKLIKAEEEKESNKNDDVMELEEEDQEKKESKEERNEVEEVKEVPETKETEKEIEEKKDNKEEEKKEEPKVVEKTEKELEEERKKLEKEKKLLKTRYELPSTPHIIVHPSQTAKGGKFTCNVATLSLLLDYRITDNKEHSFELFVFAELFNEMLMRDFGFYIYKTLYTLPEKAEEPKEKDKDLNDKSSDKGEKEKKEEKKDEKENDKKDEKKEERNDRRDDKRDGRRRRDSHSDDDRSSSPRRRSRGVELPPDPYLLLSLVYFDTARGGVISKSDLQNLFMSLGLALSRSQIRVVLEKVCVKENFSYK